MTDLIFVCLFFFLQFWIIFSTVLRFLINPNAYPPPQASTTQIIRAMSQRMGYSSQNRSPIFYITCRNCVLTASQDDGPSRIKLHFICRETIKCFFSHLKSLTEVSILFFWKVLCLPVTISPEVLLLCLCVQGQPYD